jgi:hypothetical protein
MLVLQVVLVIELGVFLQRLGRDALVGSVVYVTCHGGPLGDAFDMVEHDPNVLEIPVMLHALNQVDPTTRAHLRHLENKNFVSLVTLPGN